MWASVRECHPTSPTFAAHVVIRYVECHWAHAPDRLRTGFASGTKSHSSGFLP